MICTELIKNAHSVVYLSVYYPFWKTRGSFIAFLFVLTLLSWVPELVRTTGCRNPSCPTGTFTAAWRTCFTMTRIWSNWSNRTAHMSLQWWVIVFFNLFIYFFWHHYDNLPFRDSQKDNKMTAENLETADTQRCWCHIRLSSSIFAFMAFLSKSLPWSFIIMSCITGKCCFAFVLWGNTWRTSLSSFLQNPF